MNMADETLKDFQSDDFSYDEIMENLKNDAADDFLKIFSMIHFEKPKNSLDAEIFINHLTNHPNPVREAAAIKLEEFFPEFEQLFLGDFSKEKILAALSDINPNVSRAICSLLSKSDKMKYLIESDLIAKIEALIFEIKQCAFELKESNTKNHAKNKKLFSLYWLLEALSICNSGKYNSQVLEILNFTINFQDYTIREKTAKILSKIENPPDELLKIVKSDQNFYVKIQVYDKMNFED